MLTFGFARWNWAVFITILLMLPVLLLILALSTPETIDRILTPDDLTLEEGLEQTIILVDETASAVAPAAQFTPNKSNASPELASQLKNNYSFSDHSNQRYPGFDDCDSWQNILDDGWTAFYGLRSPLSEPEGAEEVLQIGRQYWEGLNYQVQSMETQDFARLWINTEVAEIQLSIDTRQNEIVIWASTDCLPPN